MSLSLINPLKHYISQRQTIYPALDSLYYALSEARRTLRVVSHRARSGVRCDSGSSDYNYTIFVIDT